MMKLFVCIAFILVLLGTAATAQSQKDVNEGAAVEISARAEVVSCVVVDGNTGRGRFNDGNGPETHTVTDEVTANGNVGYVQISGVSDEVKRIDIHAPSSFILTHDLLYDPADPSTFVDGSISILDKDDGQFPAGINTGDLYINIGVQDVKGRLNGTYSTWLPIAVTFCAY